MENLVSVIVCTYNQEKTIGRTLDSILRQKCRLPIEVVIGEDCSTDDTLKVCMDYHHRYPDVIRVCPSRTNKGLVDNYFDCMLSCRGRYIADCAGDDFWIDELKLEKEIEVLENHPDVGIVHTNWQYFDAISSIVTPSPAALHTGRVEDGRLYLPDILMQTTRPAIHLCTSMYRADWICKAYADNIQFFRNSAYPCEDIQVAFFLAKMGKVAYLDEVTLNYESFGESISCSDSSEKLFRFFMGATKLSYDLAVTFGLRTKEFDAFMSARCFSLFMHVFRTGNPLLRSDMVYQMCQWGIRDSQKIRLARFVTSNALLWSVGLKIRSAIVGLKRLWHK